MREAEALAAALDDFAAGQSLTFCHSLLSEGHVDQATPRPHASPRHG